VAHDLFSTVLNRVNYAARFTLAAAT
jgi:hypothetical protein